MKPNKHRLDTLDKFVKDTVEARRKTTMPFYGYRAKKKAMNSKQISIPMNHRQIAEIENGVTRMHKDRLNRAGRRILAKFRADKSGS